jgi:phosphopantetheinyl transferase
MLPEKGFLASTLGEPLGLDLRFNVASGEGTVDSLSPVERERFLVLENTPRAKSWLLGRAALRALCSELDTCDDIDVLTFPNPRFSLTHSSDVALAVAEPSGCLDGIGIDLEVDARIRPAAARFFLTGDEQSWLRSLKSERWPLHLLRLWCIKEAVFKADPGNAWQTLADYELASPGDARGEASMRGGGDVEYASWCESRTCVALAVCR